jgi:hypothetical protein
MANWVVRRVKLIEMPAEETTDIDLLEVDSYISYLLLLG